jgi:hypothetical protein
MIAKLPKARWQHVAEYYARDAHENHFPNRRGIFHLETFGVMLLYDNNPFEKYPTLRDEMIAEFRRRMRAEGIEELGYATYPGEDDPDGQPGYTVAVLIGAGPEKASWVADTMWEIDWTLGPWNFPRVCDESRRGDPVGDVGPTIA